MAECAGTSLCDPRLFLLLSLRVVLPGRLYRKQGQARSARLYERNEQGDRGRGPGYDRRALYADQRRFPACGGLSGFGRNAAGAQLAHRPLHGLRIVGPGFAGAAELSAGCDLCRKRLEERRTETGRHAFGAGAVQQPFRRRRAVGFRIHRLAGRSVRQLRFAHGHRRNLRQFGSAMFRRLALRGGHDRCGRTPCVGHAACRKSAGGR